MNKTTLALYSAGSYKLSTEEYAARNLVQPQSIRKRYAATGSYHGVRPVRLPNRRLLWPDNTLDALIPTNQEAVQ